MGSYSGTSSTTGNQTGNMNTQYLGGYTSGGKTYSPLAGLGTYQAGVGTQNQYLRDYLLGGPEYAKAMQARLGAATTATLGGPTSSTNPPAGGVHGAGTGDTSGGTGGGTGGGAGGGQGGMWGGPWTNPGPVPGGPVPYDYSTAGAEFSTAGERFGLAPRVVPTNYDYTTAGAYAVRPEGAIGGPSGASGPMPAPAPTASPTSGEYATSGTPTDGEYARATVAGGGGAPVSTAGGDTQPGGVTQTGGVFVNPHTGETRTFNKGDTVPYGWMPQSLVNPTRKPVGTSGGSGVLPGTPVPGATGGGGGGGAGIPLDVTDPTGGLIGQFSSLLSSQGFDPEALAAIRQATMGAARGTSDAALSDLNTRRLASGNTAGYYGARAGVARGAQEALAKAAQDVAVQNYVEQQRKRELGLGGLSSLLGGVQGAEQSAMTGATDIFGRPQNITSTTMGTATGSQEGSNINWGQIVGTILPYLFML